MLKSILIAIDESKSSMAALNAGVALAKVSGAEVVGLYVEDIMRLLEWQPTELITAGVGFTSGIPNSKPTLEQLEIEKEFANESKKIKKNFKDVCTKFEVKNNFIVQRGKIYEVIQDLSKTVDMVVIGKRGKTYLENIDEAGPVAEELLRNTTRPILVVPENALINNRILLAYDGSKNAQRALSLSAQFARMLDFELKVVSISDNDDSANDSLKEAKSFLAYHNVKAEYVSYCGKDKPSKAIIEEAKKFNSGIIIIGAFGENRFIEMIFGSTTKEVLKETICPVLLTR